MRVVPAMIANDMLNNLSQSYQYIQKVGNELSSGKQLNQPSDNPAGVANAIDLKAAIDANTQYQSSSQTATNWMQATTAALQQLTDVVSRARQLAVQASNDTNTAGDRAQIASEVQQLTQQVVQVGNSTYAGNYIFAGTDVQTPPFNANGGYTGNIGAVNHTIAPNYVMKANADPNAIFTGKSSAFPGQNGIYSTMSQLVTHLTASGNPVVPQNVGTETMGLAGTTAGTPYQVKVVSIGGASPNTITGIQVSADGGTTWGPTVNATIPFGTPPSFNLGNGVNATFSAVGAVGDQFNFTTTASTNSATYGITPGGGNTGAEAMTLGGTYTGANYLVQVASVTLGTTGGNAIATIKYSSNGGLTWSAPVAPIGTPPTFALGATGVSASFTNGAVYPQVGDQFTFAATTGSNSAAIATTGGSNVGNETATLAGAYTGSGTPQFAFKPATLDANDNVVGIQYSADNGVTWNTLTATNYDGTTALAGNTATTFDLGNGLTLTWNQSTVNAAQIVTKGDTLTYTPASTSISTDLSALDQVVAALSAQQAQQGAQQNAVQSNVTQLQSQATTLTKALSLVEDADVTTLATNMAQAQNLYQAALQVDAKSIEPSLVDFLK